MSLEGNYGLWRIWVRLCVLVSGPPQTKILDPPEKTAIKHWFVASPFLFNSRREDKTSFDFADWNGQSFV